MDGDARTAPAAKLTKVSTFRTVYGGVGQIIENNGELPDSAFFAPTTAAPIPW